MTHADALDLDYGDAQTVMVIADDPRAGDAAERAIALAGRRLLGRIGFAGAVARLASQPALDVVMIEMAGVAADSADGVLGEVAALARDSDVQVVVAFVEEQIDQVAARLMGPRIRLLCAPGVGDRVAALATMEQGAGGRLNDVARDEAEQLRLLNAEVARIAEALARLTRGEADRADPESGRSLHEAPRGFHVGPFIGNDGGITAGDLRGTIRARRMRANFFAADLFADPAWDMLLDLYAAELEHTRVSVSSLCIAAAVPGTTALRWIGTMIDTGLFERHDDPFDRRRAYVSLSDKARDGLRGYFAATQRAGLASA
ncbi:hypothetical protein [Sphingomonas sp.]|uniref:hypothetical protein n=1 Tax=Sphingomonas sp. TaxID=28214 RepID=UPI002C0C8B09|nr:hypothetical protein [Sphingomonas sp.]HWK36686.1 hypothetical protein [Sphingomonas sp.]